MALFSSPPVHRFVAGVLAAIALAVAAPIARGQTVFYVKASAPAGGNGQSWTTAFNNLQSALDAANLISPGQRNVEIWVAAGTYRPTARTNPTDPRSATYLVQGGISLLGGFNGTETRSLQRNPWTNTTVLTGDLAGDDAAGFSDFSANASDNAYTVLNLVGPGAGDYLVDGFTIRRANNTTGGPGAINATRNAQVWNCVIESNRGGSFGGGMYVNHVNMVVASCRMVGNTADNGGAVGIQGGNLLMISTVCVGNFALGVGGALYSEDTGVNLQNVTITGNRAVSTGGAWRHAQFCCPPPPIYQRIWSSIISGNVSDCCASLIQATSGIGMGVDDSILNGSTAVVGLSGGGNHINDGTPAGFVRDPSPGPDGQWATADDDHGDLRLAAGAGSIDACITNQYVYAGPPNDADGKVRYWDGDGNGNTCLDRGALEAGAPPYSPILYVRANAANGGNGRSWATAYNSLQSAITAFSGPHAAISEIWIATGTYTPAGPGGNRASMFQLPSNLSIYGGFQGNETTLSQRPALPTSAADALNPTKATVLSGDLNGDDVGAINIADNVYNVVRISGASNVGVDGVSVYGGNANLAATNTDTGGGCQILTSNNCLVQNPAQPRDVTVRTVWHGKKAA